MRQSGDLEFKIADIYTDAVTLKKVSEDVDDLLERDENLNLEDLEEWDSLSKMAVMAYYKKTFGIELVLGSLKDVKTPLDLIKLAGENIND